MSEFQRTCLQAKRKRIHILHLRLRDLNERCIGSGCLVPAVTKPRNIDQTADNLFAMERCGDTRIEKSNNGNGPMSRGVPACYRPTFRHVSKDSYHDEEKGPRTAYYNIKRMSQTLTLITNWYLMVYLHARFLCTSLGISSKHRAHDFQRPHWQHYCPWCTFLF